MFCLSCYSNQLFILLAISYWKIEEFTKITHELMPIYGCYQLRYPRPYLEYYQKIYVGVSF